MGLRNFDKLEKRLREASTNKLAPVMEQETERLQAEVEEQAPVRTGALRDGHSFEIDDSDKEKVLSTINNSVEYAPYVIRGTRLQVANPYPSRAYNTLREDITDNIRKEAVEYLQGVINGQR